MNSKCRVEEEEKWNSICSTVLKDTNDRKKQRPFIFETLSTLILRRDAKDEQITSLALSLDAMEKKKSWSYVR